ncbi:PCC domain-containing protein [Streptomyces griseorubiginosus]|uniref:PCC domain-containing protein n=1 Tax=Streptomyces griseorubiginosus TaxID=67304 RepID=UPI0036A0548B
MRWQRLGDGYGTAHVVVLDPGEKHVQVLTAFARTHGISGAQVTSAGAFTDAAVGRTGRRTPVDPGAGARAGREWPARTPKVLRNPVFGVSAVCSARTRQRVRQHARAETSGRGWMR